MITSNYDILLKVDIGDSRIVYFDVFLWCRGNTIYFKCLGKVLDHPNIAEVIMRYFLSHDFSDFKSQKILATKMKVNIMWD